MYIYVSNEQKYCEILNGWLLLIWSQTIKNLKILPLFP